MKETIRIFKRSGLFRAKLVASNGETVGTSSKGIETFRQLILLIIFLRDTGLGAQLFKDKNDKWRFRIHCANSQLFRSEPYVSKQKAQQGIEACKRCLEIGLVALEFSDDTNYYSLDDLANNPGLGIVHT